MYRYTIYCTEKQTKRALELGAPILSCSSIILPPRWVEINGAVYELPTAEEMLGWLEEHTDISLQIFPIEVEGNRKFVYVIGIIGHKYEPPHPSRKEATLAAIDAALDYLKTKD